MGMIPEQRYGCATVKILRDALVNLQDDDVVLVNNAGNLSVLRRSPENPLGDYIGQVILTDAETWADDYLNAGPSCTVDLFDDPE